MRVLAPLLLASMLGAASLDGQERLATVTGVVVDTGGRPIRGAMVRLMPVTGTDADTARALRASTDSAGAFSVAGVAPGAIVLGVQRDGFVGVRAEASIAPAVSIALRITMHVLDVADGAEADREAMASAADSAAMRTADSLSRWREIHSVRGLVLDSLGYVVTGADVSLLGSDLMVRTDTAGGFVIPDVSPGTYVVRTRRLGFAPAFGKVTVSDTAAPARLELWMKSLGQRLAKVTVRGTGWSTSTLNDFNRRRRLYSGVFIGQQELERVAGGRTSSLFFGRNGFTVVSGGQNSGSVLGRRGCATEVVVNGILIREATLDALVSPSDIIAIEAFNSSINTPSELLGRGVRESACGMIFVWTR